jgi:hypothetical protein
MNNTERLKALEELVRQKLGAFYGWKEFLRERLMFPQ